jgi:hypothetical protein
MGMAAGIIAAMFAAPFDFIRTVQQAHVGNVAAPNALQVVREATKARGLFALWSGSSAILARAAMFTASQLVSYDKAKLWVTARTEFGLDDVPTHVVASLISGIFTTISTAPFEMVKTYMQVNSHEMLGFYGGFRRVLKTEGVLALWRGTTPLYLKIAPHTFLVLVLTEQFRSLFGVSQIV